MGKDSWRIWVHAKEYGDLLYRRAIGEAAEMESAKALSRVLGEFYEPGMKLLDVGCGAGHYLRSLRRRLDPKISYTGVDATEYYVHLARKVFGNEEQFVVGDILDLRLEDRCFDVVTCCNVILHLPPPPITAISELVRVSRKYVVIRTVLGEGNYIIKELRSCDDEMVGPPRHMADLIRSNGEPDFYNYFNMYTEEYLRDVIGRVDQGIDVRILADDSWDAFDNRPETTRTGTHVIDGKQISGNLVLDWRFVILTKR